MNHRTLLGQRGEKIVARHLAGLGLKILARNYRTACGELDIVAMNDDIVHFIEVKTRIGGSGLNQALGFSQIRRLKKMAKIFLHRSELGGRDYAFRVFYIYFRYENDTDPEMIEVEDPF